MKAWSRADMDWALASDNSCEFTDTQTSEITYLIELFFAGWFTTLPSN
jgi:hypothetical protein